MHVALYIFFYTSTMHSAMHVSVTVSSVFQNLYIFPRASHRCCSQEIHRQGTSLPKVPGMTSRYCNSHRPNAIRAYQVTCLFKPGATEPFISPMYDVITTMTPKIIKYRVCSITKYSRVQFIFVLHSVYL